MCGILAYFNRNGISEKELKQSLNALQKIKHRGPDGEGVVLINTKTGAFHNLITAETPNAALENKTTLNDAVGLDYDLILGHRRLSIIDVSTNGHQPMHYGNGNWIVFNGEIYNYIEIRDELKKLNYTFKTATDTEVIHKAYEAWGAKALAKLNGMFSIVLFDNQKKELFVANDRFGVKPLNYLQEGSKFIAVSELRQISEYGFKLSYNTSVISNFLQHAYLDYSEDTFFNEIKRFPSSHYAELNLKSDKLSIEPKSYYTIGEAKVELHNPVETFKELFTDAVKMRLRSDVPVGFASSGGLDSSSVLYTAYNLLKQPQTSPNLATFSAVFPGMEGDESEFISVVEKDLNIKSNYINPLDEFNISDFEKHVYHQEFPVQSTSYYAEWCVAKLVQREKVKVLLVGQGGDELLAGYHHHFYRYCRQLILQGKFIQYFSLLKKYAELKGVATNEIHSKVIGEVKLAIKFKLGLADLGNSLNNKWNKADKLIDLLKLDLKEYTLPTYVRSDDRDGMAFSLESRHPFLDYRLVDFCFALPNDYKIKDGWQKWILREAMPELPQAIRYRKDKKGFTTPQTTWVNKNKKVFESYLQYIPDDLKTLPCTDEFLKYSLGAWFKTGH
jgi:asparagine synthase (glutamine-hydrolysing)